jgi:hypothetical protein
MRPVPLTTIKGGLTRLRTKGAALSDSLYDLKNGYVTAARTVKVRPGTFLDYTLPAGTIGCTAFEGKLHVFASVFVGGLDTDVFQLHVLRSPDGDFALTQIHFAKPFMGALYIAAEFADGNIYHYWVSVVDDWEASTIYDANQLASPTAGSDNGLVFRATRLGSPYPGWTAGTPRTVGDRIEPTTYNSLYFEVVEVCGDNPRSGTVEPDFDVEVGDLVIEDVDGATLPSSPVPPPPPPPAYIDPNTGRRYFLRGGSRNIVDG